MSGSKKAMLCLGERIRTARRQARLTQEHLAEMVGVSRSAISKWESGDMEPSVNNLAELAKVLNVSADYLLGLDNNEEQAMASLWLSAEAGNALKTFIRAIQKEVRNEQD